MVLLRSQQQYLVAVVDRRAGDDADVDGLLVDSVDPKNRHLVAEVDGLVGDTRVAGVAAVHLARVARGVREGAGAVRAVEVGAGDAEVLRLHAVARERERVGEVRLGGRGGEIGRGAQVGVADRDDRGPGGLRLVDLLGKAAEQQGEGGHSRQVQGALHGHSSFLATATASP